MSAHILIIDPDSEALEAYRIALAPKAAAWTMVTAQSSAEALEIAQANPPDIAVAALALDGGQGLKSLSLIVDFAPLCHAFIAADETARPQLAAAFEGGCRYLPVPCPPDRLLSEFQRCLAIDSWLENPVVKELFAARKEFESLPSIYHKLVAALDSPHASTADIADTISSDIALSGKILETVNSSFYGFDQNIADISQAVTTLGFESVKNIVLAVKLFDRIQHPPERQALIRELWHHSVSVAIAARRISLFETKDSRAAEEAYSAGLLHDIGKLVLLDAAPDSFIEAQRLARERSIPIWKAEIETVGCDHAEVGAYLLARWGLPESLSEAAALHHRPANSCRDRFSALAAVHAANAIIRHRKNPNHSDATPSQEFLAEIGKSDRWEDWKQVAIGNPAPSEKPKLKVQPTPVLAPERSPIPPPPASILTSEFAHAALAQAVQRAAEANEERLRQEAPSFGGRNTLYAFVAGVCCCLIGIYFFNTRGDSAGESSTAAPTVAASVSPKNAAAAESKPLPGSRQALLHEILEADKAPAAVAATQAKPTPAAEPPPPFPEIKLGAIFIRDSGPKAQINGRILGEGDSVAGARIVRIERISIVVEHYGRTRTFTLD